MKFGKLDSVEGLPADAFRLPAQTPAETWEVLGEQEGIWPETAVRTGGTMWNIRGWRGKVYPAKDPQRTWAGHYGRAFSTIEYNATHYRIYSPEKMAAWAAEMPADFTFCPKLPAIISHYRRFKDCAGPTDDFLAGILALGDRLGPTFAQLPPHFAPKHADEMRAYLDRWPREIPLAVEFRHPDWFAGGAQAEAVWDQIRSLGISAVLSDTAGRRDAVHMRLTAPFLLIRFGGYEGHPSDAFRLAEWADRLAEWQATGGLREVQFWVHQPDSLHTPETCREIERLCRERGLHPLRRPVQADLFSQDWG